MSEKEIIKNIAINLKKWRKNKGLTQEKLIAEIGEEKKGDFKGIRCVDLFYNKTNYELAYTIEYLRIEGKDEQDTMIQWQRKKVFFLRSLLLWELYYK